MDAIRKVFGTHDKPEQPPTGRIIGEEIERAYAAGPMKTPPSLEIKELHEKTVTIRHKNETIKSLCARTGISPRQLAEWDLERIGTFVLAAERRAKDEIQEPKPGWFKIPAPKDPESPLRYVMVD
jgi:hypothetical protein